MSRDILINVEPKEVRVAVVTEHKLTDFFVERKDTQHIVGNIYKGKVTAVVPGIGAAFVDIGLDKNGFLYVDDVLKPPFELEEDFLSEEENNPSAFHKKDSIEAKLKVNDDILVQAIKEPLGKKGPRLTTHISIPGKHLVFMPNDPRTGISRRIADKKERERIKLILKKLNIPSGTGLIARTAGEKAEERDFVRDLHFLLKGWERISRLSRRVSSPYLLHAESELIIRILRDFFTEEIGNVYIDSREEYRKALHFTNYFSPHLKTRLRFYQEEVSLFTKMGIEKEIEKLYKRIVQLKSGGYIVIEQTESLVSIDVNSGKFVGKPGKGKTLEETAFIVNKEAAEEIARQIRLRNLGGIIIIDFIDMVLAENRDKVFRAFKDFLKEDKAKIKLYPFSQFGLIEMTRERRRSSIESVFYEKCPYCQGLGHVKTISTLANEALRRLKQTLTESKRRKITLFVHPDLAHKLSGEYSRFIRQIAKKHRSNIEIKSDANLHIEEINIR
ncbi:MAG: Rne/Rng family ribonuclease [Candidatus Omnitrophica bacterium]|nr:Rne/Rng family ribonuclease [Candidatus Omnitrophota bacterium]